LRLPQVLSEALNTRGVILTTRGRIEEGTILLRHALQIALEHDLTSAALRAYNNLAAQVSQQDRFEEVLRISGEATELARRVGDHGWLLSLSIGDLGDLVYLGRWEVAAARAQEAHVSSDMGELARLPALELVRMHVERGEPELARQVLALMPDGE